MPLRVITSTTSTTGRSFFTLPVAHALRAVCAGASAAVLAALLPATALAADTSEPAPYVAPARIDRMATGRAAIKAAEWKKAIGELAVAVREQPRNADGHNLLAYASRKQATHEYIGETYLMDRQPAKAEEHLLRLKAICGGAACEEYEDLAKAVAAYEARAK